MFGQPVGDTAKPSFKLTRRRAFTHSLCALLLIAVAVHVYLDCRPSTVLAAQIPLSAPSAFVVYRPDGRALITESHDETHHTYAVDFWDAESGQSQGQIHHESKINDAAFSLDGHWLVTGSDVSADVWNLETRKRVFQLQTAASGKVEQVGYSADGQWIATQSGSAITLWDARTGQRVEQIDDSAPGYPFVISPDSRSVAYLEAESESAARLCIWTMQRHDEERCFNTQAERPGQIQWSSSGQQVVLGNSQELRLWRLPDGATQTIRYADEALVPAYALAFSPVDPLVGMSGSEQPIVVRNTRTGEAVAAFGGCDPSDRRCHCANLTFAPNGQALALQAINEDGGSADIQIWRPSAGHW